MISVESLLGWTPDARGQASEGLNESARQVARRVVADALPRLDETRRLVMALFYYEELTAEEISQALGLPAAQVKAIRMETVDMFRREIEVRLGRTPGEPRA